VTPEREALARLAGAGGPLEVRQGPSDWTGGAQFASLAAELFSIETDVLTFFEQPQSGDRARQPQRAGRVKGRDPSLLRLYR
jgi:hypothetical protein